MRQRRKSMLGFPIGIMYANAVEWVVHRYLLHGFGKRKSSMFGFHWKSHHRNARRFDMVDPAYKKPLWDWESRGREVAGIAVIFAVHAPLVTVAPWFTAAVLYSSVNYLYKHQKCHTDIEWGRRHMRHHYDHHMGKNQDANWCVTQPWFDYVMGTRIEFEDPLAQGREAVLASRKFDEPAMPAVLPGSEDKVERASGAFVSVQVPMPQERDVVARPEPEQASGVLERDDALHARSPLDWQTADEPANANDPADDESAPVPSTPPKAA